jgi:hypothetical protein
MTYQKPTPEQLRHRFGFHQASPEQAAVYERLRQAGLDFALLVVELTPVSPEQTRSVNAIDEAVMLAIAAIARNEPPDR